jgi:hypothetical protein
MGGIRALAMAMVGLLLLIAAAEAQRTFLTSPSTLQHNAALLRAGDPMALATALKDKLALSRDLDGLVKLKTEDMPSMRKGHGSAKLPSGASANSYVSFSPYYYPDPTKPGGMPWTKIDGCVNPSSMEAPSTRESWGDFVRGLETLSLAAYYAKEVPGVFGERAEVYAGQAVEFVKTFLIFPDTRMSPDLEHAQLKNDGRPRTAFNWGVDIVSSPEVLDSLGLLESFPSLMTADLIQQTKRWFSDLRTWLEGKVSELDSSRPIDSSLNNIRTIYEVFVATIRLYTEDWTFTSTAISEVCSRLHTTQIFASGEQHLETSRPDSWLYSSSNLGQLLRLARLSDRLSLNVSSELGTGSCWTPQLFAAANYLLPPLLFEDLACWPHSTRSGSRDNLDLPSESMYLFWKATGNSTWLRGYSNGEGRKISRWTGRERLILPNSASETPEGRLESEIAAEIYWPDNVPRPACAAKRSLISRQSAEVKQKQKSQSCQQIMIEMYRGTAWESEFLGDGKPGPTSGAIANGIGLAEMIAGLAGFVAGLI